MTTMANRAPADMTGEPIPRTVFALAFHLYVKSRGHCAIAGSSALATYMHRMGAQNIFVPNDVDIFVFGLKRQDVLDMRAFVGLFEQHLWGDFKVDYSF